MFTCENLDNIPNIADTEFDTPLDGLVIDITVVKKVLRELHVDAGKSMGSLLLKTMSKVFSVPLSLIFQESVDSGKFSNSVEKGTCYPSFQERRKI